VTFTDANGGLTLYGSPAQAHLAISNCTAASYAFGSNIKGSPTHFEQSLGDWFGVSISRLGAYNQYVASGSSLLPRDCTNTIQTGAAGPWYLAQSNNTGSVTGVTGVSLSTVGNQLTNQFTVQLSNFTPGVYSLYYVVNDKAGLFSDNTATGAWYKVANYSFTVSSVADGSLTTVNAIRALAGLPAVTYNSSWDMGVLSHARYIVKNNLLTHNETSGNAWYTIQGASAGQSSLVLASADAGISDSEIVAKWASGPFHAVGILDPRLTQVAMGSYREIMPTGYQLGAALDVYRGIDYFATPTYPVLFPANGKTTNMSTYSGGSTPDPLSACAGYTIPTGAPIIAQFGAGDISVNLTGSSFKQGTTDLPYCIYTETTYTNAVLADQINGRNILKQHNAVVLIPRNILAGSTTYSVSMTVNGTVYSWSFSTLVSNTGGSTQNAFILSPMGGLRGK